MKRRRFSPFYFWSLPLLLCIAALVLFTLSLEKRKVEALVTHGIETIDEVKRIHVRLNKEVLQSRLFILNHFDSLTKDQLALTERSYELTQAMDRIFGLDSQSALDAQILDQSLSEKRSRIEQFKSSISIYKNSDRYSAVVVRELIDTLRMPQDFRFLTAFSRFHNSLTRFLATPDRSVQAQLLDSLMELEESSPALSESSRLLLDQYSAHGRMIIRNAEKIDSLILKILDANVDQSLNRVHTSLSAEQHNIRLVLTRYELALYSIIGVLGLYAFVILIKLKMSNESLEVRVAERTAEFHKASEKAIAADEAKTAFLAHMSHEIRTPLNGVIGITSSLLREHLQPRQMEMVTAIANCGKSLLSLIDDVLDFSKIEARKLTLDIHPMSLRDLIEESLAVVSRNARTQNVTLLSEIDPRVPMSIEGDRNRIAQIMLNFLSNAIKFSKNGRVTVKAESRHTQDHRHQITLSVVDSGIGITEEQLNRLFQDFSQADASIAPRFGGSGLGLSISKKLAELMGGRILVQSQYGSGSTFSFVFTAQESSSPVPSAPDETQAVTLSDSHPHEILVIDDNFINRKVAADLLGTLGYTPKLAKDGLEALALMEEHRFDIAFTDLRMPGMSGYELVRRIQTGRHAHIRCIAMTASATLEEKEKCLKHGMTGFVSKPIRLQELIQILTETPV